METSDLQAKEQVPSKRRISDVSKRQPDLAQSTAGPKTGDHVQIDSKAAKSARWTLKAAKTLISERVVTTPEDLKPTGLAAHFLYMLGLVLLTVMGALMFRCIDSDDGEAALKAHEARCIAIIANTYDDLVRQCGNDTVDECHIDVQTAVDAVHLCHQLCKENCTGAPSIPISKLPNSIIFSISIYTTIGYGNVHTRTRNARIATVIYALIAIPYFLATLQAFVRSIRIGCRTFCYKIYGGIQKILRKEHTMRSAHDELIVRYMVLCFAFIVLALYTVVEALLFQIVSGYEFGSLDSFYFVCITVTTIGFGDLFPSDSSTLLYLCLVFFWGICLTAMWLLMLRELAGRSMRAGFEAVLTRIRRSRRNKVVK